jgi:hypothetical protein
MVAPADEAAIVGDRIRHPSGASAHDGCVRDSGVNPVQDIPTDQVVRGLQPKGSRSMHEHLDRKIRRAVRSELAIGGHGIQPVPPLATSQLGARCPLNPPISSRASGQRLVAL